MFGFGADKKKSAHLAGIIFGLNERFAAEVGLVAEGGATTPPVYDERNLAVIYGFAVAGAKHMNVSDKIVENALDMYFGNMSDGDEQLARLSRIVEEPTYEPIIIAAARAGHEVSTRNDFSSLRRLAVQFIGNSF
ncbi:hypothetical protein [Aromatoleum evansii]|uniref:hypothetical protein n=1 Tax=Aromatoleum evansii TaxID=59406 RepID=UPI00145E9E1C|nr:hypothetical protein [Aromatoleum evansii]NMG31092.1 hypothetical protein [Aromatoleum evansii]